MILDFFEKLTPVFKGDLSEWNELKNELGEVEPKVAWYASSGFDWSPISLFLKGRFPQELVRSIEDAVLVMSDYNPEYLNKLKKIYVDLDFGSVNLKHNHFLKLSVLQMIPFKLWEEGEVTKLKENYRNLYSIYYQFCDNLWHVVYLRLQVETPSGYGEFPVVFIPAENLFIFEQIFKKYEIPIEFFFAVRVGGKSGSWDFTHNFKEGKLPQAIQNAPVFIRPRFWGADNSNGFRGIPELFEHIGSIPDFGYSGFRIYKTNWR